MWTPSFAGMMGRKAGMMGEIVVVGAIIVRFSLMPARPSRGRRSARITRGRRA